MLFKPLRGFSVNNKKLYIQASVEKPSLHAKEIKILDISASNMWLIKFFRQLDDGNLMIVALLIETGEKTCISVN